MTKYEKEIIMINVRDRIVEENGKEIVKLTEKELTFLEKESESSGFFASLLSTVKRYGFLTFNQFVYVYKNTNDFLEPVKRIARGYSYCITKNPNRKTDSIELTCAIIKANKKEFQDRYNFTYRGFNHVNYTTKIGYTAISGDKEIMFWGNKRTENLEVGKSYRIKARIKRMEEDRIYINYITECTEQTSRIEYRPNVIYEEELLPF